MNSVFSCANKDQLGKIKSLFKKNKISFKIESSKQLRGFGDATEVLVSKQDYKKALDILANANCDDITNEPPEYGLGVCIKHPMWSMPCPDCYRY